MNPPSKILTRKRKLGDSNPRYDYSYGSLANYWFQPLTQTSLFSQSDKLPNCFNHLLIAGAKVAQYFHTSKYFTHFFLKKSSFLRSLPYLIAPHTTYTLFILYSVTREASPSTPPLLLPQQKYGRSPAKGRRHSRILHKYSHHFTMAFAPFYETGQVTK